jgi:hypothetical protein
MQRAAVGKGTKGLMAAVAFQSMIFENHPNLDRR